MNTVPIHRGLVKGILWGSLGLITVLAGCGPSSKPPIPEVSIANSTPITPPLPAKDDIQKAQLVWTRVGAIEDQMKQKPELDEAVQADLMNVLVNARLELATFGALTSAESNRLSRVIRSVQRSGPK